MTKREAQEREKMFDALENNGISREDGEALRLISIRLRSWFERECGTDNGCIERNEKTGKPFWRLANGARFPIRDMEAGAMKRLAKIMAKYPTLTPYVQGDPRGAALYILRPQDMLEGHDIGSYYSRGICIY